uniref:GATA-type domain-containing protein n=1 Tax=Meloidogyne incognita TaxID=6306 RepID=A0A914NBF5_MELIC
MLFIENKISENNEQNKRNCFNCRNVQSKIWHNCIKEYYLCQACGVYKRQNNGKFRPKGIWFKAHQVHLCVSIGRINCTRAEISNNII